MSELRCRSAQGGSLGPAALCDHRSPAGRSPPAAGDLQAALAELAARTWRHPLTGLEVRFGASTIERWYYAARAATDPMAVLRNQLRSDLGSFPSVAVQAAEALRAQYLWS